MVKQIPKSSLTAVTDMERGLSEVSLSLSISSSGALTHQQDFAVAVWRLNMCPVPQPTSYLQTTDSSKREMRFAFLPSSFLKK